MAIGKQNYKALQMQAVGWEFVKRSSISALRNCGTFESRRRIILTRKEPQHLAMVLSLTILEVLKKNAPPYLCRENLTAVIVKGFFSAYF